MHLWEIRAPGREELQDVEEKWAVVDFCQHKEVEEAGITAGWEHQAAGEQGRAENCQTQDPKNLSKYIQDCGRNLELDLWGESQVDQ